MIGAFEKQAEPHRPSRIFPLFMHDFMVADEKGERCLVFFD